jgi:diguanylate cyclase (GGDEF)-like protein/PAS domain S-box-containing protein
MFGFTQVKDGEEIKNDRAIDKLIENLPVPIFYKYSKSNEFLTNSAFDNFFGSNKKKALSSLDRLIFHRDDKFELDLEDHIGKKAHVISYISKLDDNKIGIVFDISRQKEITATVNALKERYELATQGSNEGLWDWNIEKDELYTSLKFQDMLQRGDIFNNLTSWIDLIEDDDKNGFRMELEAHIKGHKEIFKYEHRVLVDGKNKWFLAKGRVSDGSKGSRRLVGFLTDISDIKMAQIALSESKEQFDAFMQNLPAGTYMRDIDGKIIYSNRYINRFFNQKTLIGKKIDDVFAPTLTSSIRKDTDVVLKKRLLSNDIEILDQFRDKKYFHQNQFLLHRDGREYIGSIFTDITDQKLTEQKLDKLAHYDMLTNLPNRALFYDSLKHYISKAKRSSSKIALMFIDLDNFKTINDTLGHDYGDILLKKVSEKLKSILRAEDIVSRLGGDEFTVILDGIESNAYPSVVAQKIIDELMKPIKLKDEMGYIGSSIGISIFPDDALDMDILIKNADMAMYTAKDAGKNTYRYFTEEMDADTKEKMELTNDLRQATANNELILYYQPIIDIENNKLVSFEALVRWEHPKYGLVTPDFFIYLAEEGGFMAKVGRWILESVCKKIKVYQDRGYDVKIAVNISSKQLTQNHLKDTVKEIVTNTGIRADLLELEVTEGFLMENIKKVEEVLTNLRDFGIGISIDDFGTGYSSLSRLKSLPITKLKIDKSFIDDVVDSTSDQHIVSVIVSLAKGLNLEIVAEGVETREQLEVIKKEGCHLVQGYYFSKPLSESRVDQLLEDIM